MGTRDPQPTPSWPPATGRPWRPVSNKTTSRTRRSTSETDESAPMSTSGSLLTTETRDLLPNGRPTNETPPEFVHPSPTNRHLPLQELPRPQGQQRPIRRPTEAEDRR